MQISKDLHQQVYRFVSAKVVYTSGLYLFRETHMYKTAQVHIKMQLQISKTHRARYFWLVLPNNQNLKNKVCRQ